MKLYTDDEMTVVAPEKRGAPLKWMKEATELRASPGFWGEVEGVSNAATFVANVKAGRLKAFLPQGEWEAMSRKGRAFVRYIGEAQ